MLRTARSLLPAAALAVALLAAARPARADDAYLLDHPDAPWWLSGQLNAIGQAQPGFHAPYTGDTRGYTLGVTVEYAEPAWAVRVGELVMPTVANGIDYDLDIAHARGENLELELHDDRRHVEREAPSIEGSTPRSEDTHRSRSCRFFRHSGNGVLYTFHAPLRHRGSTGRRREGMDATSLAPRGRCLRQQPAATGHVRCRNQR
jgi:hypothetical protein